MDFFDRFKFLKKLLDKWGSPYLDWAQVEVTTHCNVGCVYCPRALKGKNWKKQHMSLEAFLKIISNFHYTDFIHLQGWGEPLLNDDLFEMIRICKEKGKRVGFTTNGMLLSEATLRKLIDLKLDILGVSLAGTTPLTHNKIRRGTDFEKIAGQLELLNELKAQNGTTFPQLHLAYLMLRSNFRELTGIVALAKTWGAKQIIASNLTHIENDTLLSDALFNDKQNSQYYSKVLEEIRIEAMKEHILFACKQPVLEKTCRPCSENISSSCFVNVQGNLYPCIEAESGLGKPDISFGNLETESLTKIWNKKTYYDFRQYFRSGNNNDCDSKELPDICRSCYKSLGV